MLGCGYKRLWSILIAFSFTPECEDLEPREKKIANFLTTRREANNGIKTRISHAELYLEPQDQDELVHIEITLNSVIDDDLG